MFICGGQVDCLRRWGVGAYCGWYPDSAVCWILWFSLISCLWVFAVAWLLRLF